MVNVEDFEVEGPEGCRLGAIFVQQEALIEKYEPIERFRGCLTVEKDSYGKLDSRFVQWRIKDLAYRVVEELSEATNCLKNKPWKQSEVATDVSHFKEELADALHFFVELCITAGIDAEELYGLYNRKQQVNRFRQESNY